MVEIRIQQSTFIDLPVGKVFAYASDLENMADWSSVIIALRKVSPGPIGAGTTVRSTIRFLGEWFNIIFEVIEYQPECYLALKGVSGGLPCLFGYQFEPAEGRGTTLSVEAVLQIVGQGDPVLVSALRRQVAYDLQTLKEILEARMATP